jgi:hypothetical protein
MDAASVLASAQAILNVAELAVSVFASAEPLFQQAATVLQTGIPLTDAERADLQKQEDAFRAILDAPSLPGDA